MAPAFDSCSSPLTPAFVVTTDVLCVLLTSFLPYQSVHTCTFLSGAHIIHVFIHLPTRMPPLPRGRDFVWFVHFLSLVPGQDRHARRRDTVHLLIPCFTEQKPGARYG